MNTYLVDLRQIRDFRSMQHPQRQANHLQVLATSCGRNVSWLCPDIEYDAALKPWNQKVCAFVDDCVFYSGQTVEDDCSCATSDIVDGLLDCECCDGAGDGEPVESAE